MTTAIGPTDKLVLLDNTVLSNFAFVHRADLITNIWKNCATTSQAWDELQNGILTKKTEPGQWEGLPLLDYCLMVFLLYFSCIFPLFQCNRIEGMIRSRGGFENCSRYLKSCGFEVESGLIILYYHCDMFGGPPSILPNVRQENTLRKSLSRSSYKTRVSSRQRIK